MRTELQRSWRTEHQNETQHLCHIPAEVQGHILSGLKVNHLTLRICHVEAARSHL